MQEILTVKSDDIVGRVKTYEAIVKGENIPKSGIPESFKVLVKELQSLALDIRILNHNMEEIDIDASFDDDDDAIPSDDMIAAMEGSDLDSDDITDDDDFEDSMLSESDLSDDYDDPVFGSDEMNDVMDDDMDDDDF